MNISKFVLTAALLAACPAAFAASFDCSKAQRPVEKTICGDRKLNLADEAMGRTYRDALGRLSSSSVGLLRADQVQWLAWVQQVCRADEPRSNTAAVVKCLLTPYAGRTRQLRSAVVRRDGFSFLTRTQYLALPNTPDDASGGDFPGFGTLQASWPVADTADPQWTAWNRAMEAEAFLLGSGGATNATTPTAQTATWNASLAEAQDSQVIGQLKSVEHGRATATLNLESAGHGAAHPSESFETLTWLLAAGRALRPEDVFTANAAWKPLVARACWTALSAGNQKESLYPEVSGPDAKPLQEVVGDVRNWTLEIDGLHISYPEYTVAPRVAAIDDTVIPWQQLKPVLATTFVTP